ncbi:MAG: ABC transporter ATP-binding protein/permease, partial [Burkholderiales bacterium]|nr:ABC transporter ATP-binding protein/permease [Burkholderiales bacterium]
YKGFVSSIYKFLLLALIYILLQISASLFRKFLEIKWRKWLTNYYLTNWFNQQAYYKSRFLNKGIDNPDQRISEDINSFIVLFLDLTLGLFNAVVTLVSFIIILWAVGGSLHFTLASHHITIDGYMVYAALIYAIIGTFITFKIGKPLIKLNFQQQSYEADFRYNLVRVREYGENIAFYKGEQQEKAGLLNRFNFVVTNFIAIIYRQMKIDIFGIGYAQAAIIFPIIVSAPRYFAKLIKLGDLMQINSAFSRVQDALSYFINSYNSLSGWRAVMDRLYGFETIINEANRLNGVRINSGNAILNIKNLTIDLPNGRSLINKVNIDLNKGERLLITGSSGVGKTTLLRAIAGIWPYASGEIQQQQQLVSLFIAQKPYLPIGSLKQVICYPLHADLFSNQELITLLDQCNLSFLSDQLDVTLDWNAKLSVGEQQRLAFARILINKPDIIYLDEATSALDEDNEYKMYSLLVKYLPNAAIISIGHRNTIKQWHTIDINLNHLACS